MQSFTSFSANFLTYRLTDINSALDYALSYFSEAINAVIIISDFLRVDEETENKLSYLSSRFETIAIGIRDPLDITLPDMNREIVLEDPSTNEQLVINPKIAKRAYESYTFYPIQKHMPEIQALLNACKK